MSVELEEKIENEELIDEKELEDVSTFGQYCFYGGDEGLNKSFKYLESIAEKEIWTTSKEYDVLRYYVFKTFARCKNQNKVIEDDTKNFTVFNTGLLSNNGEQIFGLFEKNKKPNAQPYVLKGFFLESSRKLASIFSELPALAEYFSNIEDTYFNPYNEIIFNIDHILDDNIDRYGDDLKNMNINVLRYLLLGSFAATKKKIKRNYRIVVPQFYQNSIGYLLPIEIPLDDGRTKIMALAIEKINDKYRANTIFNLGDAYKKARLLTKPESNWLLENKEKED